MRVSVSIDGAEPVICQMKEDYNSKEWKMNHWRGQALKSFYVTLLDGYHTVEIKALDDNIIVDQWVLDFDVDREYYVIPVSEIKREIQGINEVTRKRLNRWQAGGLIDDRALPSYEATESVKEAK